MVYDSKNQKNNRSIRNTSIRLKSQTNRCFFKKETTEKKEVLLKRVKKVLDALSKKEKQQFYTNAVNKAKKGFKHLQNKVKSNNFF
uniref:30S ribosomal protein S20 n=1 Tax=Candidatus Phytoplasma solani TaxID=69896 RepID=Q3LBH9_9MOLU|nr:hypothetical protein [Candidatus Phytoplasma solani]